MRPLARRSHISKEFANRMAQAEDSFTNMGNIIVHLDLAELSPVQISNQISKTKQMIERATGQPLFFRRPYGAHDATVDSIVERLGLLETMWSADSADSLGADWAGTIGNVEGAIRPGAIVLMHETAGRPSVP